MTTDKAQPAPAVPSLREALEAAVEYMAANPPANGYGMLDRTTDRERLEVLEMARAALSASPPAAVPVEPVAWLRQYPCAILGRDMTDSYWSKKSARADAAKFGGDVFPVYATPSAPPEVDALDAARWHPLTPELLAQIERGDFPRRVWLYSPGFDSAHPFTGQYEWRQGRHPHGFNIDTGGRIGASDITHVMPFNPPAQPSAIAASKKDQA